MQADITSLVYFCEASMSDMATLREKNANLWAIIHAKSGDDVKKGK